MAKERSGFEHQRYAERLAELEKRSNQLQHDAHQGQSHIGRKLPRLRHHHYRKNGERVITLVLLFGLVLLLMLYIITPLSKLQTVKVVGNRELSTTAVEQATTVYPGRFVWEVYAHRHQLCQQARFNQPRIARASIKMTGLQRMTVTIRENPLLGMAKLGHQEYAVLADGQLQATNSLDSAKTDYRRFDGHRGALKAVARQIGRLKPAIRNGISAVVYQPTKQMPDRIVLYMRDGNTVLANRKTVGKKMAFYPGIAANMKNAGVIDIQVGAYSYDYGSKDK